MALLTPASLCLLLPLTISWQVLADDLGHNRSALPLDIIPDNQNGISDLNQQNTTDGIYYNPVPLNNETQLTVRKCCSDDDYYDSKYQCTKRTSNMPDNIALAKDFLPNASHKFVSTFHAGKLLCNTYITPHHYNETFIDDIGQLCDYSGNCYSNSSYCIEHKLDEASSALTSMAYSCHVYSFRKCCPQDQVLSDAGCIGGSDAQMSDGMRDLQERLPSKIGFPITDGEPCELIPMGTQETDPRWVIGYYGFLQRSQLTSSTEHYCVDDHLHQNTTPQLVAHVCSSEMHKIKIQNKISKCCYNDEYFWINGSKLNCTPTDESEYLWNYPQIRDLSYVEEEISGYIPPCQSGYYFTYSLDEENPNYGVLLDNGEIEIVSVVSGRELGRHRFSGEDYCVDYSVGDDGVKKLFAFVCVDQSDADNSKVGTFALTSTLLGLSCVALFVTSISIVTTRVRRGAVTIYMVKTLTGKILLSYVLSSMLGFLVLVLNQQLSLVEGSQDCFAIAGFQLFFLLSAFFWNSSICLEMLFLTLGIRVAEWARYLGHCLWALGIPAIITTLALVLDSYRDQMPGVITPLIGVIRCSFSDKTAELLYQYIPIMITVLVNIGAVAVARHIRSVRLRELEKAGQTIRRTAPCKGEGDEGNNACKEGPPRAKSSGLRTHQAHNVWKESLKLGMWSGATWLLEVLFFAIFSFWIEPSGAWYEYLSYVPVIINCLRGVGIFFILVITPDNRVKWAKHLHHLSLRSKLCRPLSTVGKFISPQKQLITESYATETTTATNV